MWWKIAIIIFVVLVIWYFTSKDSKHVKTENNPFSETRFKSVGEELCAKIVYEYYNRPPSVNIRPSFLRNPETGKCLELDVYDEPTKTAIEYNGIQHYTFPNTFHKTIEEFNGQKKRDKLKKKICKKQKINLIVVPYSVDDGFSDKKIRYELIKSFIMSRITNNKISA